MLVFYDDNNPDGTGRIPSPPAGSGLPTIRKDSPDCPSGFSYLIITPLLSGCLEIFSA